MKRQAPPPRKNNRGNKPAPRAKRKPSDTRIRKSGNVYYLIQKERRRIPWRWVIAILLVFIGAIASAYSYAQIHSVNREIEVSRQELNRQRLDNRNLESQLVGNYSREEIERLAYERLGMREPDVSQIIYFFSPHQSDVIMAIDAPARTPENNFWQNIAAFFQGIWARATG